MATKKLDALDASKAGVSQAELEDAFLSLGTLEEELTEADEAVTAAIAAKKKASTAYDKAKDGVKDALATRDPVKEEWQRADWIVRNADPDQPPPAVGNQAPTIKSQRS